MEFLEENSLGVRKPTAYYDPWEDILSVRIRDASATWHEYSILIVLEDEFPKTGQSPYIGFIIRHPKELFYDLRIPLGGYREIQVIEVLEMMQCIIPKYKRLLSQKKYQKLLLVLRETELAIDFGKGIEAE